MELETVFKGQTQPLTAESAKMLLMLTITELDNKELDIPESPFLSQIVQRRIEAMKLPIKFTPNALLAVCVFVDRPASAVVLLIDALTRFEGQEITVKKLCDLYPLGFYTEEALMDYVNNYLKPRKVRWSEIY